MQTTNDPAAICPTCNRALAAPYRRSVAGAIVAGCVADYHTGHLSNRDARWHSRPEALRIRAAQNAHLRSIEIEPLPAGHVAVVAP